MIDFLLAMLAMKKQADEPESDTIQLPYLGRASFTGNDTIQLPRRSTAIRLVDDAKLYFDMFDIKQTGYIDIHELKLVMDFMVPNEDAKNREALNDQVEEMFHYMDKDQTGQVSFAEFSEFYRAVMVATTDLKIPPIVRRISFAKAITSLQVRTNSADIEEQVSARHGGNKI
jgi:hypothetical protein